MLLPEDWVQDTRDTVGVFAWVQTVILAGYMLEPTIWRYVKGLPFFDFVSTLVPQNRETTRHENAREVVGLTAVPLRGICSNLE